MILWHTTPRLSGPDNTAAASKIAFIFLELPEQIQKWSPWMDLSSRQIAPDWISILGGLQDFSGQVPEKPGLIRPFLRRRLYWMTFRGPFQHKLFSDPMILQKDKVKTAQCFPVSSADCWHWNNREGRHISAVEWSGCALLPFILGSHRFFPGYWLPGIQIASLLYCHLRGLLMKKIYPSVCLCG